MAQSRTYDSESQKLAKAIDLAIEAFTQECPKGFTPVHQEQFIKTYLEWKETCLNPAPKFQNLTSLKYHVESVFSYFQEGSGPTVDYFWKRIVEENLDYTRVNKLRKILDRGKIKTRIEFEYVIDLFVVAQQSGMITRDDAIQLSTMIEQFEQRK